MWAPALTPVTAELEIDVERFVQHAGWLLASGCHGVAVFGTTGEANSFSVEERMALLEAAIEAGLPPERLMVGSGCCAVTDSLRLTRHALELGCYRVLMMPPFYYKGVSDDGLFRSFATVIERLGDSRLRVFLYHFPKLSGVPVTPGLVKRLLAAYPEVIAGFKDSSGDLNHTQEVIQAFPELDVFPGSERFLLAGLEAGAAGCISATCNVNPTAIRKVFDAWSGGDERAAELQGAITATRSRVEAHPLLPALKSVVAHGRNDSGWRNLRPPLEPLDEANTARLVSEAGLAPIG